MTSLFSVIAHEDANDQAKPRQAMALAHQRVEDRFGPFVRQGSVDDQAARFSLVEDDVRAVVAAACAQVGWTGDDEIYKTIANNFVTGDAIPQLRTASVRHEARKPKMCPYHSEVTDISLAAGDPQAGFNAMAQHAWSVNHCQGTDYKGDRCKFKPAMTTQAYWDEKAEKAEQRRLERQEQAEAEQFVTPEVKEIEPADEPEPEAFVDGLAETDTTDSPEPSEPSAVGEGVEEVPMSMAAKTAAEPSPKMDKRKWTPKTVPHELSVDDSDGPHPTKRKDAVEPIEIQNNDGLYHTESLKEVGEAVTERQDVDKAWGGPNYSEQGGTHIDPDLPLTAVTKLLDQNTVKEALAKFKRN